ncbi:hypothetical protein Tco_1135105 [Tanacetum coccineum]
MSTLSSISALAFAIKNDLKPAEPRAALRRLGWKIVNTPGNDEERIKLKELMDMCTKLSDRVLDLENVKDTQALEIKKLKKRVQKLERKNKSRTSQPKRRVYKPRVESSEKSLGEKNASKQERSSDKTEELNVGETVTTARFDDSTIDDVTLAETLMAIKSSASRPQKDSIEARIDADAQLAERLQAEEREQMSVEDGKKVDGSSRKKAESSKKRTRAVLGEESVKRQKVEDDAEKAKLKACLERVPHDSAINIESLATKYPIVNWKTHIQANDSFYYQIIRADGSTKSYKVFSEMLDDFNRQDVLDFYRLVKERFETTSPEGYDRLLWGDLITLFKPNTISIHMLVEKKYPLTQEMLLRMLNGRLEVDHECEMAFELLRFTKSQLKK